MEDVECEIQLPEGNFRLYKDERNLFDKILDITEEEHERNNVFNHKYISSYFGRNH